MERPKFVRLGRRPGPDDRCNDTETMLRGVRADAGPRTALPAHRPTSKVDLGLVQAGRRLSTAMVKLDPHRDSHDEDLRTAYAAVHDAMTDLSAVYNWIRLQALPAPPARPGRRRRPWGG